MEHCRIHITSMDDEGRGRGTHLDAGGHSYEVAARGAFLGDDVLVRIERVFKAHHLKVGKAVKFYGQGDHHIERTCPHKGPCAACPLHGASESLAVQIKIDRIEHALKTHNLDFALEPIIGTKKPFGFRQKVKLVASLQGEKLRLGVYVPHSHNFQGAESCPYVNARINEAIKEVLNHLNNGATRHDLLAIKAIIIRLGQEGPSIIIVSQTPLSEAVHTIMASMVASHRLVSAIERLQPTDSNSLLGGTVVKAWGPTLIQSLEGGPDVDPDSFCQSDPEQAACMYKLVAEYLTHDGNDGTFVDAYAGVGGFSRALLMQGCRHIVAIEQAQNALVTLKQLGIDVLLKPMGQAIAELAHYSALAGIVVDPPKKGLAQDAQAVAQLGALRLALVSCDPDAMARDLAVLIQHGYSVDRIIPMDFFAGTPNIEAVVLMRLMSDC